MLLWVLEIRAGAGLSGLIGAFLGCQGGRGNFEAGEHLVVKSF